MQSLRNGELTMCRQRTKWLYRRSNNDALLVLHVVVAADLLCSIMALIKCSVTMRNTLHGDDEDDTWHNVVNVIFDL